MLSVSKLFGCFYSLIIKIGFQNTCKFNMELLGHNAHIDVNIYVFVFTSLCAEMEKTLYNQKLEEMEECLNKIAKTCVGKEARQKFWFKHTQQLYWNLEEFLNKHKEGQLLTDDEVNVFKSSEDTINVLFAVFILLGENQSELSVSKTLM